MYKVSSIMVEGNKIKNFTDLNAWKKSHELVLFVYKITDLFPKKEIFSLTNQMRRSAISIPSNIAEGRARKSSLDYRRFLIIAYGSGAELETQIKITKEIYPNENLDFTIIDSLLDEIMKILNKMINTIT